MPQGKAFFRSAFFLPTACSYVAAALIWRMSLFSGVRYGLMNTILGWLGHDSIPWLSITKPPWYWLVLVTLRQTALTLLLLSGLAGYGLAKIPMPGKNPVMGTVVVTGPLTGQLQPSPLAAHPDRGAEDVPSLGRVPGPDVGQPDRVVGAVPERRCRVRQCEGEVVGAGPDPLGQHDIGL